MGYGTYLTKHRPGIVQRKLTVGQPGDKYEQEADAMADKVMRMPQPDAPIQRKCEECEEEQVQMNPLASSIKPVIQMVPTEEEQPKVQAKSERDILNTTAALSTKLNQTKGRGSALPEATNQQMSNSFGSDFSEVRIHTDSNAIQMNRSLGARAFTHGNDIYFNEGHYNTTSTSGKHLLAHELTHTIQQSKTPTIQRWFKGTERAPVPSGTTNHVGSIGSAQWLQGHRNAGNPLSEGISFVFVGSSLSSETTTDIATRCNLQASFEDRIICLHNEVHSAVLALEGRDGDLTDGDYVCRNYASSVHDVSQQMGLSPDWETSTTHAWVEFTGNGRQYVVDAYNEILFSYPR
ncbi:eCIS core domain-containing protein [Arenibacter amylolyticus]|uniref:eCIS core domain-containing protein n=1 Tax=Arenibacter amylolyticus TaxID=1406873 RepID=UPI000A378D89|nr:DUF4157 domain-containing protein [Arenibacter amylolyticus]